MKPTVSMVLATHNRRAVLLSTLQKIHALGGEAAGCEMIVVDNASTDGTQEALREGFADVRLVALDQNLGSCAKARGVAVAAADFVLFLDDDSYPQPGSIRRMVEHFECWADLGAASFRVHLPDGGEECSAMPNVFIGCGVGLRRAALEGVGGLDAGMFMQAEEYDLSFRLVNAGWRVETFADLHIDHLKTAASRIAPRTAFYDTYNNLLVAARYIPDAHLAVVFDDWAMRYKWLFATGAHQAAYERAIEEGRDHRRADRIAYSDRRLSRAAFETLFRWEEIAGRMSRLHDDGVRRVGFADLGKNVHAFYRGARRCGIDIEWIADDRFAANGRTYREVPVIPVDLARRHPVDAVIVSNTSPVHASRTARRWSHSHLIVHAWFTPGGLPAIAEPELAGSL